MNYVHTLPTLNKRNGRYLHLPPQPGEALTMPPAAATITRSAETETATRTTTINLRVPQVTRQLIDTAAAVVGKSRTEFMLESARQHAIDVLLDQRLFVLNADQHDAFMNALENPPLPNAELKKLLSSKSPWEK
jgi:uncharacterized protein (DUF1778 family)